MSRIVFVLFAFFLPVIGNTEGLRIEPPRLEVPAPEEEIPELPAQEIALMLLKKWEGLRLESYWDVDAYRNGWGSRARKGERLTLSEADDRAKLQFAKVCTKTAEAYPNLDEWQVAVLSVMRYNVGSFGWNLDRQLKAGDMEAAAKTMQYYVNSGGRPLRGLVLRRADEAAFLLTPPEDRLALIDELEPIISQHIKNAI